MLDETELGRYSRHKYAIKSNVSEMRSLSETFSCKLLTNWFYDLLEKEEFLYEVTHIPGKQCFFSFCEINRL